jgi:sugar phosphate isomerase/epimerase
LKSGAGAAGVGICDWNLGGTADPDCVPKAREAGLDGIQVSVGIDPNNIPLRDQAIRAKYIELGKQSGIAFHSVAAGGILNSIPLASEPQSAVYVIDAIEAAAALGASNVLLAFFGKGDLRRRDENGQHTNEKDGTFSSFALEEKGVTRVVEALRQIVPRAEDAGVILGLENTLAAKQNLEIIERIGSQMVQVYYDVGNSWGNGYDVDGELRMLGNDRICEVHLKDWKTPMLGSEGCMVDMAVCAQALAAIGFNKWLCLETSGRKDRFLEDTRANVAFVKKTFHMA